MSEVEERMDTLDELRREMLSKTVHDALVDLKPDDPLYCEKMKAISTIYKELNEEAKIKATREVESDKLAFEERKLKKESNGKFWDRLLGLGSVLVGAGNIWAGLKGLKYKEQQLNMRFDKSCKFEDTDAFLKLSEKTTAQDGLRDTNSFLKF